MSVIGWQVINELMWLGIRVRTDGEKIYLWPSNWVPEHMKNRACKYRTEIIGNLISYVDDEPLNDEELDFWYAQVQADLRHSLSQSEAEENAWECMRAVRQSRALHAEEGQWVRY